MRNCSSCGQENPDPARFCLGCGSPLEDQGPPPAEERKVVTVLFCDLVGFTSRSDNADPEDVRATLRPYHSRLKQEIERFGGTVEKFIGDAVMAVFGAPLAHEDDPERAVRASLAILAAMSELNTDHPGGAGLSVRIGVNTGPGLVVLGARPALGEAMVTGDVVNTAARLQTSAPVDAAIVGEATWRATRATIDYEELPPITVKGKTGELRIWRAMSTRSRLGSDTQIGGGAFVGREYEMDALRNTFGRTLREGSLQLVTIVGEPGVGKSRLVGELLRHVDAQDELVAWRQGRCLPYGEGITFWALGEIVKAQAGILDSDGPEAALAKLDAAIEAFEDRTSEREWLRAKVGPLVGMAGDGTQQDREESFTAWLRFLEGVASRTPLVMVLEDLHWADDALLAFLEHLAEWSTGVPLLVVGTTRPELFDRHPSWASRVRNAATISLSPLSRDETSHLIAALLDRAVLPAEVQELLLERSGGNPLYAEEFVRMLTDQELIDDTGRLRPDADSLPFPDSVQALIASRLDTLTAERKALVQDAAVVGKVFWSGAVAAMGSRDREVVRQDLHELARREYVRPQRTSSVSGESEHAFSHALIRDVAYEEIPRAARAAKHRAAASWIEEVAGERASDLAEVLSYHYRQALQLTELAGDGRVAQELRPLAAKWLTLAGDRAMSLDVAAARGLFETAVALVPEGSAQWAGLTRRLADAHSTLGGIAEATALYRTAVQSLEANADAIGAAGVRVRLANLLWYGGEPQAGRAQLSEALALLEHEPLRPEFAHALTEMANQKMEGGEPDAVEWSERALATARSLGLRDHEARALVVLGCARYIAGDRGGVDDCRVGLALSLEAAPSAATIMAFSNYGFTVSEEEGPAAALEVYRRGQTFCAERGMTTFGSFLKGNLAIGRCEAGQWSEALATMDALIEADRARGGTYEEIVAQIDRIHLLCLQGRYAEADAALQENLPRARASTTVQQASRYLQAAAETALGMGRTQEATAFVEEFIEVCRDLPVLYWALSVPSMVRVALRAGAIGLARPLAEMGDVSTPQSGNALLLARAFVLESEGDGAAARALFESCVQGSRQLGQPYDEAQARFGLGRCLIAEGREDEAAAEFAEANRIFTELGARPMVRELSEGMYTSTNQASGPQNQAS